MNSRIVYTARSEKKKTGSRRRALARFGAVLVFFGVVTGIVMMLGAEQFQVKTVSFSGLKILSAEELKTKIFQEISGAYVWLFPKRSIFLVRASVLGDALQKEFPRLRTVAVGRKFPAALAVAVEERELWAILCNDANTPENAEDITCVYIDETGFAFEEAPYSIGSLILKIRTDFPEVRVGEQALAPEIAQSIRLLETRIGETGLRVWRYEFLKQVPSEIRVETDEGFALIFLREDDFANTFRVLKTVLEQEIKEKRKDLEYIDLRFGNKVFFKMR
mgnify:CR=1 FL=1